MKNKKIKFLILAVALVMGVVGCNADDTEYRNMQTRLNDPTDNGWLNDNSMRNIPNNTGRLNTNLNNGMTRRNDMNNNDFLNNGNQNNGMLGTGNERFNDDKLNTRITDNAGFNNNMIGNNDMNTLSTRANKIAKRVARLKEISSASVVINENTAVVGIEGKDRNMSRDISSDLRKRVEAAVKSVDRDIDKVSITSDPDIHSRLKTMSNDMRSGNMVDDFADEIRDIMRRITEPLR